MHTTCMEGKGMYNPRIHILQLHVRPNRHARMSAWCPPLAGVLADGTKTCVFPPKVDEFVPRIHGVNLRIVDEGNKHLFPWTHRTCNGMYNTCVEGKGMIHVYI